jgi:hypothetical protein
MRESDQRSRVRCPLSRSKQRKATARRQTAVIKSAFPPGLAEPALRALLTAGFSELSDLTQLTRALFASLHGIGPKAVRVVEAALNDQGLSFRPESSRSND